MMSTLYSIRVLGIDIAAAFPSFKDQSSLKATAGPILLMINLYTNTSVFIEQNMLPSLSKNFKAWIKYGQNGGMILHNDPARDPFLLSYIFSILMHGDVSFHNDLLRILHLLHPCIHLKNQINEMSPG